jgi:hypothetical protein
MESNPSEDNIKKLLNYFMSNHLEKLTSIIVSSVKLFSYSNPNAKINVNIEDLMRIYESTGFKNSIFSVLAAILSTASAFNFEYKSIVESIWKKSDSLRTAYYKLIGATIAYYN